MDYIRKHRLTPITHYVLCGADANRIMLGSLFRQVKSKLDEEKSYMNNVKFDNTDSFRGNSWIGTCSGCHGTHSAWWYQIPRNSSINLIPLKEDRLTICTRRTILNDGSEEA
ncbi:hypothetical protein pipiens_006819 [Culex pipiens pipiens]|uniref:Uncharacterized protein n=1 Tax=Culex pipiens pipiens TaxID=38569 RepID=A0ABD1DNW0_CULPP